MRKLFTYVIIAGLSCTANLVNAQCAQPSNISSSTTTSSVTVNADYPAGAKIDAIVETSAVSANRNVVNFNNITLPYTANGLINGQTYYYKLRSDCNPNDDSNVSPWSDLMEFTVGGCQVPTNIDVESTNSGTTLDADYPVGTTVDIVIDTNPSSTNQNIGLNQIMVGLTLPLTEINNFGLVTGDTYYYRLRTNCGNGDYSEWSDMMSFVVGEDNPVCEAPTDINYVHTNPGTYYADFIIQGNHPANTVVFIELFVTDINGYSTGYSALNALPTGINMSSWISLIYSVTGKFRTKCSNDVLSEPVFLDYSLGDREVNDLNAYPNPTQSFITLEGVQAKSVSIADFAGNVKRVHNITNNEVNLQGLASGNYVLNVTDKNGKVSSVKIIKK